MRRTAFVSRGTITPKPGKCKFCKDRLDRIGEKLHDRCVGPWYEANKAKIRMKAQRAEKAQDRAKREAMKSIPELIAEAQEPFNKYVRLRDWSKGCFVCDRPFIQSVPGRAIHAGHVRSRAAAGHLRFNEDNCHGECEGCNGPHGARPHQIKAGAIRRIGAERFEALENDNTPHKWTHDELRGIRDTYRAKAKELKHAQATG